VTQCVVRLSVSGRQGEQDQLDGLMWMVCFCQ